MGSTSATLEAPPGLSPWDWGPQTSLSGLKNSSLSSEGAFPKISLQMRRKHGDEQGEGGEGIAQGVLLVSGGFSVQMWIPASRNKW